MDAADAAVKKMEDENKGALKGLVDKLGEIIKIIAEMKDKLMAALRKGWETIKLILADPIGFLSNLLSAVKGGLQAFVGNIVTHLKTALFEWLLGPLGAAGISVPRDFSLTSIFKLVLDVLGLTWPKIRQRAVAILGETTVKVLETAAEFVAIFIRGGPAALWEKIKESLSDLKSIVIDGIRDWVISTIVTQGVTRIVSMFNPAGAFVQACIAIYNVVMFLVERAAQIWAFVQSIIDSVHAIATGSIGGAIRLVEASLARLLPLVISFLARLIGLGGITGKILGIIRKIQAKVEQAIDKVIGFLGKGIKRMLSGISRGVTSLAKAGANKVADMIRQGKSVAVVRPLLAGIKAAMRLSMLDVSETKTAVVVKAAASPTETETVEKGKVGPLSFPRPKFSGKLTRAMKLKDGQARRHVISYSDMASHYTKGLAPKTFDDAWKDLAAVPQGANKVAVTKLASGDDAAHRTAIGGTAQKMLKAFNEDAENLSPGPTIPNSALQENVDLRALFEKQAVPDAPLTAIRTVETKTERPVDAAWLARTAGAQDKMKTGLSQHITKVVGKYMLPGGSLAISNSLGLEITASFDATTKSATLVVSKAAA
jgi:hypothetical protein